MNQYLIPANSKKSRLIFGFFKPVDLVIVIIGAFITFLMLLVFKTANAGLGTMIMCIVPILIAVLLVFPVPNYHNIRQLIVNIVNFIFGRRKYYWKGWCVKDESYK